MTIMAGSSQLQSHRSKSKRDIDIGRNIRSKSRNEIAPPHPHDTESESSGSPVNEFSNVPTYRVPTKSRGGNLITCFHAVLLFAIECNLVRFSFLAQKCFGPTRAQNQTMTIRQLIDDRTHRVMYRPI